MNALPSGPDTPAASPAAAPSPRIVRLVLIESSLWAAGNALTTGIFLFYFVDDLGASGVLLGVGLAVPEISGVLRLLAPSVITWLGHRKRAFLTLSVLARLLSLGIPLMGFPEMRPDWVRPLWLLVGFLFVSQASQWLAYVAYLSWLSDLIPRSHWGRFFGLRNICRLAVLMVVPLAAGAWSDQWRGQHPESSLLIWGYVVPYFIGAGLMAASLVPMALLPHVWSAKQPRPTPSLAGLSSALSDRRFLGLIGYGCWLSVWSGLIQVPYSLYAKEQLSMGLVAVFIGFHIIMPLCQMPVSYAAGQLSDRFGNKPVLILGLWGVALGPVFWLFAGRENWPIVYLAFVMWGGWAAVNICQQNLMLKLSPAGDNAAYIGVFQGVTGLCAGISGIAGGYLLDCLADAGIRWDVGRWQWGHYQLLFLLSVLGRGSAILWLLPLREPGSKTIRRMTRVLVRWSKRCGGKPSAGTGE